MLLKWRKQNFHLLTDKIKDFDSLVPQSIKSIHVNYGGLPFMCFVCDNELILKSKDKVSTIININDVIGYQKTSDVIITLFEYPLSKKKYRKRIQHQLSFKSQSDCNLFAEVLEPFVSKIRGKRYVIIVNPYGGMKLAATYLQQVVEPMYKEAGIKYDLFFTEYVRHAQNISKNLPSNKYDALVVISGDGTIHEVVNGIMQRADWKDFINIPIGSINGGTANCITAAILNERGESRNKKIAVVNATFATIKGVPNKVSGMKVTTDNGNVTYVCHSVSWGILSEIEFKSVKLRVLGDVRYKVYGLEEILLNKSFSGKVFYKSLNDDDWKEISSTEFSFVSLMMSGYWSLTDIACPHSSLSDHCAHLMLVKQPVKRKHLIELFLKLESGEHAKQSYEEWHEVQQVKFEFRTGKPGQLNLDGEHKNSQHVTCEVVPNFLNLLF